MAKIAAASAEEHRPELAVCRYRLMALLIVIAGLWAYHNSFQGPFIFDDLPSIPNNPHIQKLWPIWRAMSASSSSSVSGRPVVCLTLALNYALGGLNVWGYHAFNVMVHLLSALVLFGILRRTFVGEKLADRFGSAAVWLAGTIAVIWEVHPLQTESVTYIVERTESLMGLFLLLTVYCVLRSSQSSHPRGWQAAAILACALGMGSKEVMVGAPLIVLLYDRVFLVSSFRELWQRRAGLYVGLAGTWLILAGLVATTTREMSGFGMENLTSWDYLKTEASVLMYYLRLCFWPIPLVIDYSDWPVAGPLKDCLAPVAAVVALLGATLWAFRRRPWLGFLGAWFFLILAPTSSFMPSVGEAAAERRMYLPLAAVVTLITAGGWRILSDLPGRRVVVRVIQGLSIGILILVVLALSWLTMCRNEDYRSDALIWWDVVVDRPHNVRALVNLGTVLMRSGRADEALTAYEKAVRLDPNNSDAQFNLGLTFAGRNQLEEAEIHLKEAVRIVPRSALGQYNLGVVFVQRGNLVPAAAHLAEALRIDPRNAGVHCALGSVLARQGSLIKAERELSEAVRLQPDYAEAHANLGLALAQLGRLDEAVRHWEAAVRIDPKQEVARQALERVRRDGK